MYLDSSAIVKLVAQEAETRDLGIFLVAHREHRRITSALAGVEVMRACADKAAAKRVLGLLGKVPVSNDVLDQRACCPEPPCVASTRSIWRAPSLSETRIARFLWPTTSG